jgi:hypothetical protein
VMRAHYYAIGVERLAKLMTEAGFRRVQRLDEVYYQPLLIGHRPVSASASAASSSETVTNV